MSSLSIRVHTEIDDELRGDWLHLASRLDAPPWLAPAWYDAWMEAFGADRPHIVAAYRAGRLAAVVALHRDGPVIRSMSNYHTPAFDVLGQDVAAVAAVADAAVRSSSGRLELRFLPDDGAMAAAGQAAAVRSGRRCLVRIVERSPVVDTSGAWATYEAGLRRGLRQELRRRRRRLEELGGLQLTVEDGHERLNSLLDEGFAVEGSGWKGRRGTAMASADRTRRFYERVAHIAATAGVLRLAFLRLDGRALAFDLAIEHGRVHYLLKTGYLEEVRKHGPGMLLRYAMLRRAFESDITSYAFLGHNDGWKLEWATETAPQLLLQVMSTGPLGLIEIGAFRFARPLVLRALGRAT